MITAGTRVGPYEVTSVLGAGGMGEVFRARDTRLGRDVALKIMVAQYTATAGSFVVDKPRPWSEKRLAQVGTPGLTGNFDLAPDGKRIIAVVRAEGPSASAAQGQVTLMLNFFDHLRRTVQSN